MKWSLVWLIVFSFVLQSCGNKEYAYDNNIVTIYKDGGAYTLTAVNNDIFKVTFSDSITYSDRNYATTISENIPVKIEENETGLKVSTEKVYAEVTFEPVSFSFYDISTGLKLSEEEGYIRDAATTKLRFKLSDEEAIYGTGERALPLNRRGYQFAAYNAPRYGYGLGQESLNYSIPHISSSKNYMLLIDNPAKGQFDIGKTEKDIFEFSSEGGNMVYYFINGTDQKDLLNKYTDLTGKQYLPPIWALGNLQSRFGYRSRQETEEILDKTIDSGYPVDAVILDIYWFGPELEDGKMGQLDWDLEKWPEPEAMVQGFADKGVKTITVSEPFFTMKSKNFQTLSDQKLLALDKEGNTMTIPDFYFGEGGLLDIFKPEAQDWIWNEYKSKKAMGIDGWWVDLGEPEKHPEGMIHVNGTANEIHGAYGHQWTKVMYEGYAKEFPNERLFKLGRAGFAGSQAYGLIPWSGDVSRSWSGFQAQLPIILGMGMSGLGYMHSDAGGFTMAEKDPELYARWMQFAAWTAIFRPHGDANVAPAEPALWDKKIQGYVRPSVELRYKLLPYNYSLAFENEQTGIPLARPMFFEYDNIPDTLVNQFMWGKSFLVAPVLEAGKKELSVYLPEGNWYNYWTNYQLAGGNFISQRLSMNEIPVYVKEGSIIPSTELVANTEKYTSEVIDLTYYLGPGESEASVYFDDGKLKAAYEKGKYQLLNIKANNTGAEITLETSYEGGGYDKAPSERKLNYVIVGLDSAPQAVSTNGQNIAFSWDSESSLLVFTVTDKTNKITIQL